MLNVKNFSYISTTLHELGDKGCELGDKVLWEWRKSSTFALSFEKSSSEEQRKVSATSASVKSRLPDGTMNEKPD